MISMSERILPQMYVLYTQNKTTVVKVLQENY